MPARDRKAAQIKATRTHRPRRRVGRITTAAAGPVGTSWMWTLMFDCPKDRTPMYGYEPTREAAMAAFATDGGIREELGAGKHASAQALPGIVYRDQSPLFPEFPRPARSLTKPTD